MVSLYLDPAGENIFQTTKRTASIDHRSSGDHLQDYRRNKEANDALTQRVAKLEAEITQLRVNTSVTVS